VKAGNKNPPNDLNDAENQMISMIMIMMIHIIMKRNQFLAGPVEANMIKVPIGEKQQLLRGLEVSRRHV